MTLHTTTGRWRSAGKLGRGTAILLLVALAALSGNYIFFMLGLSNVTPGAAAVVIQTAPMFLLLGGVVVFKESYSGRQFLGLILVIAGLAPGFLDPEPLNSAALIGAALVVAGSMLSSLSRTQEET